MPKAQLDPSSQSHPHLPLHPLSEFGDRPVGPMPPHMYHPKAHPRSRRVLPEGYPPGVHPSRLNELFIESGMAPITISDLDLVLRAIGQDEADIPALNAHLHSMMDITIRANGDRMPWIGAKPEDLEDTDDLSLFHIPDSSIAIRIFPGDTDPRHGMCYLDFYDTVANEPVNSPEGFQIHPVGPPIMLMLGSEGPLMSVEEACGISRTDIKPGQERFGIQEGALCRLDRPGLAPFHFEIPTRPGAVQFAQAVPFAAIMNEIQ
ncbi:hypothetical protein C8R44DRAFT_715324 [Mycena epipterygia]|nr:hypothetical protein C8R44DRAFT_715324 [Mycena epipterygia]